jgi:hypothetical protein
MKRDNKGVFFDYKFTFKNGQKREFHIDLDDDHLNLIQTEKETYPEWVKLSNNKCSNCTLDEQAHPYCPIAVNMIDLIEGFGNHVSHEMVNVVVETGARKYSAQVPLQKGLSALIGLYMPTGGCPVLEKLKPMVKYHLPFATRDETMYRVLSMYLLAQYFRYKHEKGADWHLKDLSKLYEDIKIVNTAFCARLNSSEIQDASLNALVILDIFADAIKFTVDKDAMKKIETLFDAYMR